MSEQHRGTWYLNPSPNPGGGGLRFVLGCSCGQHPTKAPLRRGAAETRWHDRHRRELGLELETSSPVYGPDAAAAGMTWDEWYPGHEGLDPWTGEPR